MTRIAVIADIHGNADALKAVLGDIDAQGIETILNLGDHFSGPLAARETAEILMARPMLSVRGNHDRYLTEQAPAAMAPSDRVAFDELEPRHLDWLRALPSTARHGDLFLCHATPADDETYFLETVTPEGHVTLRPRPEIEALARATDAPVILCAHTHLQRMVRLADGRLIVNPGSVGCPGYTDTHPVPHVVENGVPDAAYAVLSHDGGAWRVTCHHVRYDTARMVALAVARARQEWASALATGWINPAT